MYKRASTETNWHDIYGNPLESKSFRTIKEASAYIQQFDGVPNAQIYGLSNFDYAFIHEMFPDEITYDKKHIKIGIIDIEVGSENGFPEASLANEEIQAITLKCNGMNHVLGCGDYTTDRRDVDYIKCKSELDLISKFIQLWRRLKLDIVTGWFIEGFDIPYIINRITKLFGEYKARELSPFGWITKRDFFFKGTKREVISIYGVSILDYYELYRKFELKVRESYTLNHISYVELKEKKLDFSEHGTLHKLYKLDYQKFIDYNIKDVELVERIDQRKGMIDMVLAIAYIAKVNYLDALKQVRLWDMMIYSYLMKKNIIIPARAIGDEVDYEGAFVKDTKVGMFDWIVSMDINSLYPNIILSFNISPEKLIQNDAEKVDVDKVVDGSFYTDKPYSVAGNGAMFDKNSRGFLPEIIQTLYNKRVAYKTKMLERKNDLEEFKKSGSKDEKKKRQIESEIDNFSILEKTFKVTLNSAYGALGNRFFRFFDVRQAEAITISGQIITKVMIKDVNDFLNKELDTKDEDYIVAGDTDSIYIHLGPILKKHGTEDIDWILDYVDTKIQAVLDTGFARITKQLNAYENKFAIKREAVATRGIWTAKKRYALNVLNDEGVTYTTPEIKIKGLEAIKSTVPEKCRDAIKECLRIIMNEDNDKLIAYIKKFRGEFEQMRPEDISTSSSISDLKKYMNADGYYTTGGGAPWHVKGAIVYNHALKEMGLDKTYESIKEGVKIKTFYLRRPNRFNEEVLSVLAVVPKEFDLEQYIDYNTQFDKVFLRPLSIITDKIGWKTKNILNLGDM